MRPAPQTLAAALKQQATSSILQSPVTKGISATVLATNSTPATLTIGLVNQTTSSTVYAYISGLALNNSSAVVLIESDGVTPYYPANPSADGTALSVNCAIPLGAVGTTTNVTIPQIAGGRIWTSIGGTLNFYLNPGSTGAALVEPSVSNSSDTNYLKQWDFCELTYDSTELNANISYVDFVSIPIALTLTNTSGTTTHVSGIPTTGLATIASGLQTQNDSDGAGWDGLIITDSSGSVLRVVSPNTGFQLGVGVSSDYYDSYVDAVWTQYATTTLTIDTQSTYGTITGTTASGEFVFGTIASFDKPSTADIFSCSTGPFANPSGTNADEILTIQPRLAAPFNRSTLLIDSVQPDDEIVADYYQNTITNHYSRIVHAANLDSLGYAFPYDDVTPSSGNSVAGSVVDTSPSVFTVTIGGANAYAKVRRRRALGTAEATPHAKPLNFHGKRSLQWDETSVPNKADRERDLESGLHSKLLSEFDRDDHPSELKLPPIFERIFGKYLTVSFYKTLFLSYNRCKKTKERRKNNLETPRNALRHPSPPRLRRRQRLPHLLPLALRARYSLARLPARPRSHRLPLRRLSPPRRGAASGRACGVDSC